MKFYCVFFRRMDSDGLINPIARAETYNCYAESAVEACDQCLAAERDVHIALVTVEVDIK